ncbi:MAG: sialate O-acetylesterase [Bacteroidales bacterium]|nr:sialate O-acetylesterase [Bacteroidales bacterium]
MKVQISSFLKAWSISSLSFLLVTSFQTATAAIRLPHIIDNGMVLQRNDTARIWGWAEAGETVQVKFVNKKYVTAADADGRWMVKIPTTRKKMTGGPYTMQINDRTLTDIYVGDVWLCSGQSNMDLHCARLVELYQQELKTYSNPAIHLIQTARNPSAAGPQEDIDTRGYYPWQTLVPENVDHWSGIGYFYAKAMFEATGVPQGIINASMGGSDIVAWCSEDVLAENAPKYISDMRHLQTPGYLERNAAINRAVGQIYNKLYEEEDPGLQNNWMQSDFDDSDWEVVDQYNPNLGDENGRTWRGSLWFRKEFQVPAELCGREALLRLGCLVDADVCYINGQKVGETGYQYPPRKYVLKENLLKPGRNVLCIRLKTNGSREKFVKDKPYKIIFPDDRNMRGNDLLALSKGEQEINLEGKYKMHRGVLMPGQPGVEGVNNARGASLYNNVIYPMLNVRIAGILWYQGETNAGRPEEYLRLLPAMMADWRESFGEKPVVICGLANFMQRHSDANYPGGWARLREVQRICAQKMPNAAFVNLADIGEWNDIHPLNKKDAARRISLQMRRLNGEKHLSSEGPVFESVVYEGNKAVVTFRLSSKEETLQVAPPQRQHTSQGVVTTSGQLEGFKLAGKDGRYHWAKAQLLPMEAGSQLQKVVLVSDAVSEPANVRYGWDDDPLLTLYSTNGLPAVPFTTETIEK